jgi:hypothetical protein
MKSSLWREHVLPFSLLLGFLVLATLGGDYLLHRLDLVWVGRYLGIPGTLLIIGSLYYSLRKRKYVSAGNPKTLLKLHEFGTWLGSLMVLIHAASTSTPSCPGWPRRPWASMWSAAWWASSC